MQQTENYQLSLWNENDRILMESFNADNARLDAALDALKSAQTAQGETLALHAAAIAGLGSCQIYTASYVGSGKYGAANKNSITFPHRPVLALVFTNANNNYLLLHPDSGYATVNGAGSYYANVCSRSGNALSWWSTSGAGQQMNNSGYSYYVVALLDAAQ